MAALIQEALAHPNKAKAARDVAIFLLLGYGRALRRGEVVGLDLEHFDPRGSRLIVLRKGKRERQLDATEFATAVLLAEGLNPEYEPLGSAKSMALAGGPHRAFFISN